MATPEETRVDQLVTSVNEVAQLARTLFFSLLLVALTVAAIVVGTTDDAILRNSIDVTPTLGVRLSVSLAHMFAPVVLLFLHVNALIQLDLLGARWTMLDQAITDAKMTTPQRDHHHARLNGFAVIQHLARAEEVSWRRRLLRVMTWITVVGVPLVVLLALQVGFLRYQSDWITFIQKVVVVLDTLILWWFLRRRKKREGATHTVTCPPSWWRPMLRIARWLLVILVLIFVLSYGLQIWLLDYQSTKDGQSATVDHGRLAMSAFGALALVVFALLIIALIALLCRHPRRGWLLWLFAIVSVVIANPPSGQEAKDVRWMETAIFSKWWKTDTLPRQQDDSFEEGVCSSRGARSSPSEYKPWWTDVFVWPALKLCNPLDIYVCPYIGWGCRYLQLANTTQIVTATPPGVLKDIMAKDEHVSAQLRIIGLRQRGRSFRYANLKDALLFGADLIGADLQKANLEEANLQGAWLDGANLSGAVLDDAHLEDASFDGANLEGAALHEAKMRRANFDNTRLAGANFNRSELMGASFNGARFDNTNLKEVDLRGVDFSDATLTDVDFNGSQLQGAGFLGASLKGTPISADQLGDATMLYAELGGVAIAGLIPSAAPKPTLQEAALSVARDFTTLACEDQWTADGIMRWVSYAYDRENVTKSSWEWVAAREILNAMSDAITTDPAPTSAAAKPSCPGLDEADFLLMKRPLRSLGEK